MDLELIEERFSSYSKKFCNLKDFNPFLLAYIRLLLLFEDELSEAELDGVHKRQRQLHGEQFEDAALEDLRKSSMKKMDGHLRNNNSSSREALLNSLLFGALLDTEETDFFYLTEPMFEFVEEMEVSPDQIKEILESEFVGFKV